MRGGGGGCRPCGKPAGPPRGGGGTPGGKAGGGGGGAGWWWWGAGGGGGLGVPEEEAVLAGELLLRAWAPGVEDKDKDTLSPLLALAPPPPTPPQPPSSFLSRSLWAGGVLCRSPRPSPDTGPKREEHSSGLNMPSPASPAPRPLR